MENVTVSGGVLEMDVSRFITIEDVIENIHKYVNEVNVASSSQMIIIDATRCRSNISLGDLGKLKHSNELLCESFKMLKVAIILNDPVYTAICMVYQNFINSNRYQLKVFSTRGAAQRWLKY